MHTPEYTRALFQADRVFCADHFLGGRWDDASGRRISDEIESRRRRQDRLGQADRPVDYTVLIEEAVLRKVVGDRPVMRTQLLALVDFAGNKAVTIRVVPEKAAAQADTDGGFVLLDFPDPLLSSSMLFAHYPGGVVAEHEPHVVGLAERRFDAVLATALPEGDSVEVIEQLAEELYSEG